MILTETYQAVRNEEKIKEKAKAALVAYGGTLIKTKRTMMLQCLTSKWKSHPLQFHVVDKNVKSLLGLPDCLKMNIISLKDEVHEISFHKDMFIKRNRIC